MTEEWRDAPGWAGYYEVSDQGRVRRIKPAKGAVVGRVLRQKITGQNRYPYVMLSRDSRVSNVQVHKLVALAFLGPCPPGREVAHRYDDPTDNRAVNLRWATRSQNRIDRVANGLDHNARKTHCPAGHAYDEANTYYPPRGGRVCRACQRAHVSKSRRARRRSARQR